MARNCGWGADIRSFDGHLLVDDASELRASLIDSREQLPTLNFDQTRERKCRRQMFIVQPRSWHRLTLISVGIVGVAFSAILAFKFYNSQVELRRHQLVLEASSLSEEFEQYLHGRETTAKTVSAVFEAPALSSLHPLGSFAGKVLALTPEVRVMAWVPQVDPSRVNEVLNALAAAGGPPGLYAPNLKAADVSGLRRMLYPVVDVEPKTDQRKIGLGMEIGLDPVRKAAFERARDQQRVVATAPVLLLPPNETTLAYILYSPVYNDAGFAGCLMFAFRIDHMLARFFQGKRIPMNFRAFDATDPGQLLYLASVTREGQIELRDPSGPASVAGAVRRSSEFAGRKIDFLFEPGADLKQAGMKQAAIVAVLGLTLTGIVLWCIFYFMRSSRRLAAEIATSNSMKVSLELTNRELTHRVGNLMAVAQGIVRLSYDKSFDTLEFKDMILARLHALHQSVGLINRKDWTGVSINELMQTELAPVADRIDISGHDILLIPKAAQSLSLLFYELMTNSSKHGALATRDGRVSVRWEVINSDAGWLFCFQWDECGLGYIAPPTRQGFGTKLLTRLVPGDLMGQATLNYESNAFRYRLQAPLAYVVEQANAQTRMPAIDHPSAPEQMPVAPVLPVKVR